MTHCLFSVPPGYRLVPEVPTYTMWMAGRAFAGDAYEMWHAMLRAAPPEPDRYRALVQRADRATEAEISAAFEYDTGRRIP